MRETVTPELFEVHWNKITEQVSSALRLIPERRFLLRNNMIAKHITLIPFISETDTPERDACSSLSIYLLSVSPETKHLYSHDLADDRDPFQRLMNLMTYSHGSKEIQRAGIALIVMNMIHGYIRDRERDVITGKYNPIVSGLWDPNTLIESMNDQYYPYEPLYAQFIPRAEIEDTPWKNIHMGESQNGKKVL